jgi:hypothetical protein
MKAGHITDDGMWPFAEVECMGNCASARMVQINDDNYEDLTPPTWNASSTNWRRASSPKTGTQLPAARRWNWLAALSNLTAMVGENHDYRGWWLRLSPTRTASSPTSTATNRGACLPRGARRLGWHRTVLGAGRTGSSRK